MKLIITIDTEGDNAWAKKGLEDSTENSKYLPRFQSLCNKFGFKPTYLTTYEMGKDKFFVEFAKGLLKKGCCEVGCHPHPWNQPPQFKVTRDDMALHPYMIEYPYDIMRKKVTTLTNLLENTFESKMRSHRAGRWLFNHTYACILADLGYKTDCSVTPLIRWPVPERLASLGACVKVPDYSVFSDEPYFLNHEDISRPGTLPILEIPMTIIPNYGVFLSTLYRVVPSKQFKRAFRGVFGQQFSWFRPGKRNSSQMLRVARVKLRSVADYIMFMLHSSELMPGGNPWLTTSRDIDQLYDNITGAFEYLYSEGVSGATCSEFHDWYVEAKDEA